MAARKITSTLLLVLVCIVVQLSAAAHAEEPSVTGTLLEGGVAPTPNNNPRDNTLGGGAAPTPNNKQTRKVLIDKILKAIRSAPDDKSRKVLVDKILTAIRSSPNRKQRKVIIADILGAVGSTPNGKSLKLIDNILGPLLGRPIRNGNVVNGKPRKALSPNN